MARRQMGGNYRGTGRQRGKQDGGYYAVKARKVSRFRNIKHSLGKNLQRMGRKLQKRGLARGPPMNLLKLRGKELDLRSQRGGTASGPPISPFGRGMGAPFTHSNNFKGIPVQYIHYK